MTVTYFSYQGNHINGKDSAKGCSVSQAQRALSLQGRKLKGGLKPPRVSVKKRDSFGVTYSITASKAFWRAIGVNC